jgi:hypothetical protein
LLTANSLVAWSLIIGTPFFLVFGALSDRIRSAQRDPRRLPARGGTYFPLFHGLTKLVNPQLEKALETVKGRDHG